MESEELWTKENRALNFKASQECSWKVTTKQGCSKGILLAEKGMYYPIRTAMTTNSYSLQSSQ